MYNGKFKGNKVTDFRHREMIIINKYAIDLLKALLQRNNKITDFKNFLFGLISQIIFSQSYLMNCVQMSIAYR